jgi:hypothetical protein
VVRTSISVAFVDVSMGRSLHIEVTDEQYERLNTAKENHGLTWRGMLILAAEELEND